MVKFEPITTKWRVISLVTRSSIEVCCGNVEKSIDGIYRFTPNGNQSYGIETIKAIYKKLKELNNA